jgi:hypothetical protein
MNTSAARFHICSTFFASKQGQNFTYVLELSPEAACLFKDDDPKDLQVSGLK